MKTGRRFSLIRMIRCCLVFFLSVVLAFHKPSHAGGKSNDKKQLEPVVTFGATVRGLTKPFETTIDDKRIYFQDGLQFVGQVKGLDVYSLDLRIPDSQLYFSIPFNAITKLEMKIEKKNWPITAGTLIGLTVGVTLPIDKNDAKNIRSVSRIGSTTSGIVIGVITGLFVKHLLPDKWQDIPLEQARLGIKRSINEY